jgi:hypothetical protein
VDDLAELGTVEGVADLGFAPAAWFIDPDHNGIGPLQLKDPAVAPAAPRHMATGTDRLQAGMVWRILSGQGVSEQAPLGPAERGRPPRSLSA